MSGIRFTPHRCAGITSHRKIMKIIMDPGAGFCPGVRKVIQKAEELLKEPSPVYSLGQLIHNQEEIQRLQDQGLNVLDHSQIPAFTENPRDITLLIRAHGEPPTMKDVLQKGKFRLVDGTCSIVRSSQKLARQYYENGFRVVIVGKKNHPETIGINGYCQNRAIIVEQMEDIDVLPSQIRLFVMAQTTTHPSFFASVIEELQKRGFRYNQQNTICKFIKNREEDVAQLARGCDAIIVAGGKNSSNTGVLYKTCHDINPRTYRIEKPEEIQDNWFSNNDKVGITGGASTPPWLMQKIKDELLTIFPSK